MTSKLPIERENPPVDEYTAIGSNSAEDCALRLACLVEAREQAVQSHAYGFGDILYRARLNARFVMEGRTLQLRPRTAADDASGGSADA